PSARSSHPATRPNPRRRPRGTESTRARLRRAGEPPPSFFRIGRVGYVGVFSDTNSASYLDAGENVAHTVLGVVAIAAAFLLRDASLQKWLVVVVGIVARFFGVYGFIVAGNTPPNTFGVSNLESPADDVLHLVVGIRRW